MLSCIQTGDRSNAPLVLIHDGGGTTCSYHYLANLDRDVYTIENPRVCSGRSWRGGIPAMAKVYSALVNAQVPLGDIILGGWSFGGLVSLEMVDILSTVYGFRVIGVVLLDSVYPGTWKYGRGSQVDAGLSEFKDSIKPLEMKLVLLSMMKQAVQMASQWEAPSWAHESDQSDTDSDRGSTSSECSDACCTFNSVAEEEPRETVHKEGPPVILLRCTEKVQTCSKGSTARVDVPRDCESLGWDHFRPGLVTHILPIHASHFQVFSSVQLAETNAMLITSLDLISRHREMIEF